MKKIESLYHKSLFLRCIRFGVYQIVIYNPTITSTQKALFFIFFSILVVFLKKYIIFASVNLYLKRKERSTVRTTLLSFIFSIDFNQQENYKTF